MKPLEGIWWEVMPSGIRHHARLRGSVPEGVRDVSLLFGGPGDREWRISLQNTLRVEGIEIGWERVIARGPWRPGDDDPCQVAWQWCRLHLAPTVRSDRAAVARARWAQGRKEEEGA